MSDDTGETVIREPTVSIVTEIESDQRVISSIYHSRCVGRRGCIMVILLPSPLVELLKVVAKALDYRGG
eukprot:scaffold116919_cov89-Cyclotella_meneghiniana.AAC.2